MPLSIDRALTPTEFADAWIERQRAALVDAAGRDGRLTRTTAQRMAERGDVGQEAADDLIAFFDRTGQQSVSVNRFLDLQRAFIVDSAAAVAGANGVLSLVEARALPATLRSDYLAVRGRVATPTPALTPAQTKDALVVAMRALLSDATRAPLSSPPSVVRGTRPVVDNVVVDPQSGLRAIGYVAGGHLWASLASQSPSPRVGWYDLGAIPSSPVSVVPNAMRDAIVNAAVGVNNTSDSDAPYRFCFALNPSGRPITPDLVRQLFEPQHAELAKDIFGPGTSLPSLTQRAFEVVDTNTYFAHRHAGVDPNDPASVANDDKLQNLGRVLARSLSNLVVVRFGDPMGTSVKGAISGFIVGRTASGDVAGVFTGSVET